MPPMERLELDYRPLVRTGDNQINLFIFKFKITRTDGHSPSFFKDCIEMLTSESAKLLGSFLLKEVIPKDKFESMTVLTHRY